MTTAELTLMQDEVKALARERGAVILAHNYQVPEVQDVADYVGDSLGLSRQAAAADAETIVFCGVHFMAETAAILSPEKMVLLPDMYLGLWLEKVTGRKLTIWLGECHVHAGIRPADIERWQDEAPDADLLVHPECGCASQAMAFGNERTQILSTEKMIDYAKRSPKQRFLVATETGIIHRLQQEAPGKRFEAVRDDAECRYMKLTTLEKVRDSLRDGKHRITVEARQGVVTLEGTAALERMVEVARELPGVREVRTRPVEIPPIPPFVA